MKKLLLLVTIAGCGSSRTDPPDDIAVTKQDVGAAPELVDDMSEEDALERTRPLSALEVGLEMYRVGQETERLHHEIETLDREFEETKREIQDLSRIVFLHDCLEQETGKDIRGEDMERHFKRNTKQARACKTKMEALSPEQVDEATKAIVEREKDDHVGE